MMRQACNHVAYAMIYIYTSKETREINVTVVVIPDTTKVERALHGSLDLGSKFGQDVWEEIQYCGSFSPESLEDGLWRRLVF